MYQQATTTSMCSQCIAHVTTNRNRPKVYGNSVYLKNGQNFEIELFNPTTSKVLAKINLNGKTISNSGIVLRPGERVYLERFIDSNNKFVFETYEVENSTETINAIANNGMLEIYFYQEQSTTSFVYNNTNTLNNPFIFTSRDNYSYPNINCVSTGLFGNIGSTGISGSSVNMDSELFSSVTNTSPFGGTTVNNIFTTKSLDLKQETGRIEKGKTSDQVFEQVSADFNWYHSNMVSYKLIPESQKPVEVSTLRNYCTSCGTRVKKSSWKFCPSCGEKY